MTLEEAFKNTALAMLNYVIDPEEVRSNKDIEIDIGAENLEALLYLWLEEFLILFDSEFFLPHKIKEVRIENIKGEHRIKAKVTGDTYEGQYDLAEVKAATYNEMSIVKTTPGWEITAVVDI